VIKSDLILYTDKRSAEQPDRRHQRWQWNSASAQHNRPHAIWRPSLACHQTIDLYNGL